MSTRSDDAAQAAIGAAARELHLPTVRAEATRLAEIAVRERQTHLVFLAEVLAAEVDDRTERRRARRIAEAKFPRLKRLSEFNVDAVPSIQPATLAALATGNYLDAGEPIVLLGDSGTGKSHLLIALGHYRNDLTISRFHFEHVRKRLLVSQSGSFVRFVASGDDDHGQVFIY